VDPSLSNDQTIVFTYTYSSILNDQFTDPNTYQTHQAAAANPYFTRSSAVHAAGLKVSPSEPKKATPVSDPFSAPGVPKPLPFPVHVANPVVQQTPWLTNSGTHLKVK
jgi:hypothetical protein